MHIFQTKGRKKMNYRMTSVSGDKMKNVFKFLIYLPH